MTNNSFTTGSVQFHVQPITSSSRSLRFGWSTTTGSVVIATEDRTGQLVRHGDHVDVWLVRETNKQEHTLVNERNEEQKVGEDTFWPWGAWQKVAG
jgi:hypothetical protein